VDDPKREKVTGDGLAQEGGKKKEEHVACGWTFVTKKKKKRPRQKFKPAPRGVDPG